MELNVPHVAGRTSFDVVFSLCYEELRRLAGGMLCGENAARVSPTTLVNEAWMKMARSPALADTSPLHFRRVAGRAMRHMLVDAARRRLAQVHGGGQFEVMFDESLIDHSLCQDEKDVLALHDALDRLQMMSPRQSQLVEGRFFGGLSWAELAELLAISESTVMREWRSARAWLAAEVKRSLCRRREVSGDGL